MDVIAEAVAQVRDNRRRYMTLRDDWPGWQFALNPFTLS